MTLLPSTFAAIDFETANSNSSSVCSVGIVIVREGVIVDSAYRLIRPVPNFYSYWNTKVHGMSCYDTDEECEFPQVWSQLEPLIEGLPLIAHNSPFDEGCLKAVHRHFGMPYPGYKFYCTVRASRKLLPQLPNHKLNTVAAHCGYNLTNHHHALADAEACSAIALYLSGPHLRGKVSNI